MSEIVMTDEMWEELKRELFMNGTEALEDFLGYELSEGYDKDAVENALDDISAQMPDEEQLEFYKKYVSSGKTVKPAVRNYVNDAGSIATVCMEQGQWKAYVEPDSVIIGPYTGHDDLKDELINRGFYEAEN